MLTDWGDGGHPQFLPVSYLGYAYGAAAAWNADGLCRDEDAVKQYLNLFVFQSRGKSLADLLYRMGNCYLLDKERLFNNTWIWRVYDHDFKVPDCLEPADKKSFENVKRYANELYDELSACQLDCPDGDLIIRELKANLKMVMIAAGIGIIKLDTSGSTALIQSTVSEIEGLIPEFVELWNVRNHSVGSDVFVNKMSAFAAALFHLRNLSY